MNIQQLFADLQQFQDTGAGTLTIPVASISNPSGLDWPDIATLFNKVLASDTLTLTGITSFPSQPSANIIRYQGNATLFPWSGSGQQTVLSVTASFSVDSSGSPQLYIRADLTDTSGTWTLGNSLHGLEGTDLAGVAFENGFFLLTSAAVSISDYPGTAEPFANFKGQLSATGPIAVGATLLPTPDSRTVAGTIDLSEGDMPVIALAPAGAAPITLAGIALEFGASLASFYEELPYYDPANPSETTIKRPFSRADLIATLAFGGQTLDLSLTLLPASEFHTLSVGELTVPLASWNELDSLTGGIDLGTLVPETVPAATSLVLKQLSFSLYFPDSAALPRVDAIFFNVAMNVGSWPLLPNDILTVSEIGSLMTLSFGDGLVPAAQGSLYTAFDIVEEVPMLAELSIPTLNLSTHLQPGVTVSVSALMASVMEKLTGKRYEPPIDMDISRLEFSADILNRTFGFGTDILTDWSIDLGSANGGSLISLGFDGISFDIDYDGQLLQADLTAFTHINEAMLYFSGSSPGNDTGWGFSGGLMSGSTLSVTNLLTAFMYPDGNIPGGSYGVPQLQIDLLQATLATDTSNNPVEFTFKGGMSLAWDFKVFDGQGSPTFKLTATLSLKGTKGIGQAVQPRQLAGPGVHGGLHLPARRPVVEAGKNAAGEWVISGDVQGTFSLFNLLISAGYEFSPDNSALSFGIWYKERGIQATVTQKTLAGSADKQTILTVRLGDLSFGEILEYLINLALPGENRRLGAPWDILYQINFKNLELEVNLTTSDVAVAYRLDLDLKFARFDKIGLIYKSVNGEGRVFVELEGEFLGQSFGDDDEPLAWDVLNDDAPEVPGKGPQLIDLRFVGMGQHIALSVPVADLDTVEKVITALKASMKPVSGSGNPLTDPAAASLRYDGNSNWMFGLDATLLSTFSLSAVFFDPVIYGGLIAVSGERGGALNGLRFELLYRKISDDIGELSVDLRIPDMFRHLEFGEVSVTLGMIHVDIFTNGNFRVDLGFPHNEDFSVSFAVEVFPFIGEGGLYFAYLTGATSDRVPQITNGDFDPVIEAGIGLSVGLGKDFQAGPLKAGLKVEVYGIFEGVFAPFEPYDKAVEPGFYFWVQGTAGIVGTLYGSVDFVVIKASVSIVARASATLVLEAHKPTEVELKVDVTAKASVKILFVRVHFSFSLTIEESFTIGSATATPWIEGSNSEKRVPHAHMSAMIAETRLAMIGPADGGIQPFLRQQRGQRPQTRLTRLRHARHHLPSLTAHPDHRSLHVTRMAEMRALHPAVVRLDQTPQSWPPIPVFGSGTPESARLQFLPMFSVADPASLYGATGSGSGNQTQLVLGFMAENTVDPEANGHAERAVPTADHVHHVNAAGDPPLATMAEAFFRWAAAAGAGKTGTDRLTRLQIEDLLNEMADPAFQQATFGYDNLSNFLHESLHFEIAAYPQGTPPSQIDTTSGTFVPVCPAISAQIVQGSDTTNRDYAGYNPVSAAYATNLAAYFQQLLTNATRDVASMPTTTAQQVNNTPSAPGGTASLAELIFGEYFLLMTQAAVQGALALLQNYPYTYPATGGPSLDTLAGQFPVLTARHTLARGQTLFDLALQTGHHPRHLAAANPLAARGDSRDVDVPVGVTALSIAEDNPAAPLATDLSIAMPALAYQVRSGQSLDEIAAAIPFVDASTPLTGLAIGTASQHLKSLLRQGTTLSIPAFTYSPVAGDTQNFLTAFFKVRNEGIEGAPNLDWYEQAISTLNPSVDWSQIGPSSPPIGVPTAYLNSTAASATYTIHTGDSLATIAATFARYQAMDNSNDPPVTAPTPIPAMDHTITSTDTFAALAGTVFPGLALNALITANTDKDVLTPLTALHIAPFTAKIPSGQSLQSLASAYDLGMADLVDIVAGIDAIFVGGTDLTIRDVPALPVDQFVTDLKATAQLNTIATQVSNFLAHGLRAPAPDDTSFTGLTPAQVLAGDFTGTLYGIADLTGQQFPWTDPQTTPIDVTLSHAAVSWLSFTDATVAGALDGAGLAVHAPRNPRLFANAAPSPGLLLATNTITDITLTVDQATFGTALPSATVTLNAQAPAVLSNFEDTPVHYNMQVTQHWQAGARPALPAAASNAGGAPGEPSLWPLPSNLQKLADAGGDKPFALEGVALTAPPDAEGDPLVSYAWAIQLPIVLHRVANPTPAAAEDTPGGGSELGSDWVDGLYLCKGTDAGDTERLYDLWTYLAQAVQAGSDSGALYLLYPPNATGATPKGYASDAVDTTKTVLLKTNLSTVTRDPMLTMDVFVEGIELDEDGPPSAATYSAPLSQATDFLTLLWEASVVVEGGFYLHYDADGAGLPDFVFDENGRGTIQIVCLLNSQTSGATSGGPLLALNNIAVVGDNVDASATQIYAEQTGAGAPTTRLATIPPGTAGFTIERTDPSPQPGTDPTPAQLSGMLYGLIGYKIGAGSGFTGSNEAVPQGPAPTDDDVHGTGDNVLYKQVLSLFPRAEPAGRIAQNNPWLPAAAEDPYAGVSASSGAALSFAAHDIFGNKATVSDPLSDVTLADRYTDRMSAIGDWPGTSWSYTLSGASPAAMIEIDGALQINSYLPAPDLPSEKAVSSASAHALKFAGAFYQIGRPGITVSIETSLASGALSPPLAPLIAYVSASYIFTSQIAALPIATHSVTSGQTLSDVTGAHSVPADDLLRDNIDRQATALFPGPVTVPTFAQVKHNETLNAFATRVGVSAHDLLTQWHNADTAIVPAQTNLIIAPVTGTLSAGKTLAAYAAESQCTAGDIGRANQDVPGLIADNLTLAAGGVTINTNGSTFVSLVADFANAGVTTTPEAIAVANQSIVDLFAVGGTITTYAVDRRLTAEAATVAQTVTAVFGGDVDSLITLNGALPGLITQNTRMQTGSSSEPVPDGESLRRFLGHLSGITIADFAAANQQTAMTTGSVLLLPALLDPSPLAAVAYGIQPGVTLDDVATLFATTADTLGTQNQDIPGIFVPGQTVTVSGSGSVTTDAEDSIASLRLKFPAQSRPDLAALIAAIGDQQGLLLAGAVLICPAPAASAGSTGAVAPNAVATAFLSTSQSDALRLCKANAALSGFLKAGAQFTVDGHTFTVGPSQTLANSLAPLNAVLDAPLAYDDFLRAILSEAIVDPAARIILPPPDVVFGAALPAAPAVTNTITQLSASVTLARPTNEIDTNFAGVPEVQRATSPVPPRSSGVPATLAAFGSALATAYSGALWGGTGPAERTLSNLGNQRQYGVRFDAPGQSPGTNAIRKVEIGQSATAPSYLALPPLANALVSREASVRTYQSGATPPFSETAPTMFQAVDVMDWAVDFLATVDMVLSPNYAAPAYQATSAAGGGSVDFDRLVAAKESLAEKIAAQLTPIEKSDNAIDLTEAQTLLGQQLRQNLSQGFGTDAVVQVPTDVEADFASTGSDAGGHRLTGKTNAPGKSLSATTTLQALATGFGISVVGVIELVAATPNILATGTTLTLNNHDWQIGAHDTLATGIDTLQTTPEGFAEAFATQAPLFRDDVKLTIDGYSAIAGFGDTLTTMADALDVSLRYLAVANMDVDGLLTGTVYLKGRAVTVTPQTSSLSKLAAAESLTVEELAGMIAEQAVLADGAVMHTARWVPEYSLTPGKIDLVSGDGALTMLLSVKNRAHYRRLFLNLAFDITALEFAVEQAAYVDGYETSKWLHFLDPLPETPADLGGAVISTDIGQLDIPIPLRAYPSSPRLVNQRAVATYTPGDVDPNLPVDEQITKAKAWSYYASLEMQLAAQDTANITIGLNFRRPPMMAMFDVGPPDPFQALAEFATNAAAIKADLATLLTDGGAAAAPARSAVAAIADIAKNVADNWGFVQNDGSGGSGAGDGLVPDESYRFRLQKRTRSGADGESLLDAIVLIRAPGTNTWGPGGQIPSLGYIDTDGKVKPLQPQTSGSGTPQDIFYNFQEPVPDRGRRTYVIWYDDLDVSVYQNARASLSIRRNQNLVPGKETADAFVYSTPELNFTNLAVPELTWDRSILFGTGTTAQVPAALTTLFTDVLGSPPTDAETQQKLSGRYGYRLAAANGPSSPLSPDDIVSLVPMFYRPLFAYAGTIPSDTGNAVDDWFSTHSPQPANTALLSFSLQLFSDIMPDRRQPLIALNRLDYQLS